MTANASVGSTAPRACVRLTIRKEPLVGVLTKRASVLVSRSFEIVNAPYRGPAATSSVDGRVTYGLPYECLNPGTTEAGDALSTIVDIGRLVAVADPGLGAGACGRR